MKRLLSVTPLLLIAAACNQAPAPADPSGITSGSQAWEDAMNAGDADALAAVYTSDARLLPPNLEMASGTEVVRAVFGGMIEAGVSLDLTSIETKVEGSIGYNVGTYEQFLNGEPVDKGKFVETWQRGDDGQWRISNDIFNSDLPAKPAHEDGMEMTHLVITHKVTDAEHWLNAWRGEDSRHQLFKENGAAHVHTLQSADDPNLTGLVIAVTDMEALHTMLSSAEGQAAAAADGVDAESMQSLIEAD